MSEKAAFETLETLQKTKGTNDNYALVCGDKVEFFRHTACLGQLFYSHVEKVRKPEYFVNTPRPLGSIQARGPCSPSLTIEEAQKYAKWLVEGWPFGSLFVTREPDTIVNKGIILKTNLPAALVILTSYAVRYIGEFPYIVRSWCELSRHTENKMLAWAIAHAVTVRKADGKLYLLGSSWGDNHTAFVAHRHFNTRQISNILAETPNLGGGVLPMYKNCRPTSIYNIWGPTREERFRLQEVEGVERLEAGNQIVDPKAFFVAIEKEVSNA